MINAIHIGLQSTWLFTTPAALAASASCSVNGVPAEFKRAICTCPVVGEEGANIAFAKGERGILALHYMSFLMVTENPPFCCYQPGTAISEVSILSVF